LSEQCSVTSNFLKEKELPRCKPAIKERLPPHTLLPVQLIALPRRLKCLKDTPLVKDLYDKIDNVLEHLEALRRENDEPICKNDRIDSEFVPTCRAA
jgi:hypothetical protein